MTLAWACTVYNVQGLTLQKTVVSLDLVKQRTFSSGQIYAVLSPSKSLSKLNILSDFDHKTVRANQLALEQYEYLRKEKIVINKNFFTKKPFVALLNIHGMLMAYGDTTYLPNRNSFIINNCC